MSSLDCNEIILLTLRFFSDELEADSIPTSHTMKSIFSNDSISNKSNTVQSEKDFESDQAVIAGSTTMSDSSDSEANDDKKVSKVK